MNGGDERSSSYVVGLESETDARPSTAGVTTIAQPPDVLVVGAGIIGLCCAHVLSERGHRVEVLEASEPGAGATGAAAGMISPLIESEFDEVFAKVCRTARDLWPAWAEWLGSESGQDLSFHASGTLFPAFSSRDLQTLDHVQQVADRQAENWERWSPEQVHEAAPRLRKGALSGLFLPNEFSVDPNAVIAALRKILLDRGIAIHTGRTVTSYLTRDECVVVQGQGWSSECEQLVVAAGAGVGSIEGPHTSPVRAVKGQMIAFRTDEQSEPDEPTVRVGDHYALTRSGEVLIGATVEENGFDLQPTEEGKAALRKTALELFPRLQWKAVARHWAGLRPATPDHLPLLGPSSNARVILAAGHYRNGILLAPWTARVVADLLAHGSSSELPEEFSPLRF